VIHQIVADLGSDLLARDRIEVEVDAPVCGMVMLGLRVAASFT
jgi:hypothetical protein